MIEIIEVIGPDGVKGLEIIINGKTHFIADQDLWPGIRIGKFPSPRWQDIPWAKNTVYKMDLTGKTEKDEEIEPPQTPRSLYVNEE